MTKGQSKSHRGITFHKIGAGKTKEYKDNDLRPGTELISAGDASSGGDSGTGRAGRGSGAGISRRGGCIPDIPIIQFY